MGGRRSDELCRFPENSTIKEDMMNKQVLPEIKNPEVLEKAIKKYGVSIQSDMAIEEMSELTKAILKNRRIWRFGSEEELKKQVENIVEEAADVLITVAQVIMMYDYEGKVQDIVDFKINRLRERLEKEEITQ